MTKEEIMLGNKIMADYLGYIYYPHNSPYTSSEGKFVGYIIPTLHLKSKEFRLCRSHRDLPFYNDWNSLMRVVDKIEDYNPNFSIFIKNNVVFFGIDGSFKISYMGKTKKEACWIACLDIITHYRK